MEVQQNNMGKRITLYDEYYGFLENPSKFNFDTNPHRLIIKNYALRTGDKTLYEFYLKEVFPDQAIEELHSFGEDINYIKQMGREELALWLINNKIKILQSDINTTDKDAIFRIVPVSDTEDPNIYLMEQDGLILNNIAPSELIKFPYHVWINTKLP
ncbi:hypothetical protein D3C87_1324300 [compost metagenome]